MDFLGPKNSIQGPRLLLLPRTCTLGAFQTSGGIRTSFVLGRDETFTPDEPFTIPKSIMIEEYEGYGRPEFNTSKQLFFFLNIEFEDLLGSDGLVIAAGNTSIPAMARSLGTEIKCGIMKKNTNNTAIHFGAV